MPRTSRGNSLRPAVVEICHGVRSLAGKTRRAKSHFIMEAAVPQSNLRQLRQRALWESPLDILCLHAAAAPLVSR